MTDKLNWYVVCKLWASYSLNGGVFTEKVIKQFYFSLFPSFLNNFLERVICIYLLCLTPSSFKSNLILPLICKLWNSLTASCKIFSWILSSLTFLKNLLQPLTIFWEIFFPHLWRDWNIVCLPTLTDWFLSLHWLFSYHIDNTGVPRSVLNSVSLPFLHLLSGDLKDSCCLN